MSDLSARPGPLVLASEAAWFCLGLACLILAQTAGELAVNRLGLPLPGALIGMLLLLAVLIALGRVPKPIDLAAGALLRHIMLFLMPVVAGVLEHLDVLAGQWLPFLVATLVGSALTLVVTAALLKYLLARGPDPLPATAACATAATATAKPAPREA